MTNHNLDSSVFTSPRIRLYYLTPPLYYPVYSVLCHISLKCIFELVESLVQFIHKTHLFVATNMFIPRINIQPIA
jgi:hypothetical protein